MALDDITQEEKFHKFKDKLRAGMLAQPPNQSQLFDYFPEAFPYLPKHPNCQVIKYGDLRYLSPGFPADGVPK
jgi:hypothetical protein